MQGFDVAIALSSVLNFMPSQELREALQRQRRDRQGGVGVDGAEVETTG